MAYSDAEVKFKAGEKQYTLYLGNRALRESEKELGFSISKLDENVGVNEMTIIFWAGLTKHHPDLTIDDADDIIDEIGHTKLNELFTKAMKNISSKKNRQAVKTQVK